MLILTKPLCSSLLTICNMVAVLAIQNLNLYILQQTYPLHFSILMSSTQHLKRELLSLVGKLSFACKVVPAGHIFLCRLIDLSTTVKRLHHHIQLTTDAHLDLQWWLDFLPCWSGKTLILDSHWTPSTRMQLFTDASRKNGWGAYSAGRWLQGHWSEA